MVLHMICTKLSNIHVCLEMQKEEGFKGPDDFGEKTEETTLFTTFIKLSKPPLLDLRR